jgi:hypothetical protein
MHFDGNGFLPFKFVWGDKNSMSFGDMKTYLWSGKIKEEIVEISFHIGKLTNPWNIYGDPVL